MRVAIVPALLACVLAVSVGAGSVTAQTAPAGLQAPASPARAAVIALSGPVDEQMRRSLDRHLRDARATGATTIILSIDTYGGLVTSGLEISALLKRQTALHTIAFIDEKALSAGAMIALACDEIVMAPYAKLGDCAPIMRTGDGALVPLPDTERSKQESPILADFKESARRNGYDVPLAMSMVTLKPIYYLQKPDGTDRQYEALTPEQYKELVAGGAWVPVPGSPNPVVSASQLLTINGERARELGFAKSLAPTVDAMAKDRGLTIIATYAPSIGDTLVELLGSTPARGLLLVIFLLSLYVGFHAPGHGAAEVIALTTLGALLGVPLLTGYATWWEILAILVGVGLLALEIFVIPGFGVTGVLGLILMVGGLILTFAGQEPGGLPGWLPQLQGTRDALLKGLYTVVGGLICSLLLAAWLRRFLPKIPYMNRLILTAVTGDAVPADIAGTRAAAEDTWPFLGTVGKAVSELKPGGMAEFPYGDNRRLAAVISDSGYVSVGSTIVVRDISGNGIVVRAVPATAPQPTEGKPV